MHSWVFRNREELARIYGLARSAPTPSRAPSRAPASAEPASEAPAARVVPMARVETKAAPRLPLARLGRFVLRPKPRARRTA
ncbi:MAG: hypothetical protein GC161_08235 [Planctomycetaceae bacterium]|nr:hypothetical protein [Planctomycetaceae bacterium]